MGISESDGPITNKDVRLQKRILSKYQGMVCLIQSEYFPQNSGSLYTQSYNHVRIVSKDGEEGNVEYDITHQDLAFNGHAGQLAGRKVIDSDVSQGLGGGNGKDFFLRLNDSIFALAKATKVKPEDLEKMLEHLVKKPKQLSVKDIRPFFQNAIQIW